MSDVVSYGYYLPDVDVYMPSASHATAAMFIPLTSLAIEYHPSSGAEVSVQEFPPDSSGRLVMIVV